jgi:hypothetical protein
MTPDPKKVLEALYICASHHQGGHSRSGGVAACALGIPFPLNMDNLAKAALRDGLDPRDLWPWWSKAPRRPG